MLVQPKQNKYSNKPAKGYKRIIGRFYEDPSSFSFLHLNFRSYLLCCPEMVPHRVGGSETLVKSTANLSTLLQSPMGLAADG